LALTRKYVARADQDVRHLLAGRNAVLPNLERLPLVSDAGKLPC